METAVIISIVALVGTVVNSCFSIINKCKKSDCVNCKYEMENDRDNVLEAIELQNKVISEQIKSRQQMFNNYMKEKYSSNNSNSSNS